MMSAGLLVTGTVHALLHESAVVKRKVKILRYSISMLSAWSNDLGNHVSMCT